MKEKKALLNDYENCITKAIAALKQRSFEEAYELIIKAMDINPNVPEPHNLLGICYEGTGDKDLARKHYRIAYILNPKYKPAGVNLERVSRIFESDIIQIEYGEELQEQRKGTLIEKTDREA